MVREELGIVQKARSFNFRRIFDRRNTCHANGMIHGKDHTMEEKMIARTELAAAVQHMFPQSPPKDPDHDVARRKNSDIELMKEKFSKLLLGEDMSGGGKGVSSALALSNAITNLAASVFGEQRRLEPMDPERKNRWIKEVGWLLSITDFIVEFVPSRQTSKEGVNMEIMTTQQRRDLRMNIPALRKLDLMLVETLDNFRGTQEFTYESRNQQQSEESNNKWWLPTVKVPPGGLSKRARLFLQKQKEAVNQVLKASMAINSQILADMNTPESYIETLPRNGRDSLGEIVYKSITDEFFNPVEFLAAMDFSSEHKVVDLKNRIEASIVIWKRKMTQKDGKSLWTPTISLERRELFEERAETILILLKQNFPGIPQSTLEISKIQYNRDVGLAIMESYSRVLETLASTVMSRIQEVLHADSLVEDPSRDSTDSSPSPTLSDDSTSVLSDSGTPSPKTKVLDFIESGGNDGGKMKLKPADINTTKKFSYLDQIEMGSLRSPAARH